MSGKKEIMSEIKDNSNSVSKENFLETIKFADAIPVSNKSDLRTCPLKTFEGSTLCFEEDRFLKIGGVRSKEYVSVLKIGVDVEDEKVDWRGNSIEPENVSVKRGNVSLSVENENVLEEMKHEGVENVSVPTKNVNASFS